MAEELTIDQLMEARAQEDLAGQIAQEDAIPKGEYEFKSVTIEGRRGDNPEIKNTFERGYLHFFGSIHQGGERKGSTSFDASWERRMTESGRTDGMTRRWNDLIKALDLVPNASAAEVRDAALAYPFTVNIELGYGKDGEKLAFPKTDEEVKDVLAQGFMPRNWVRKIGKVK